MGTVPGFALDGLAVRVPGRTLLHPLDLELTGGRVVGLVGHNGSGKSTLLSVLARQRPPTTGTVRLSGRALASWPARALARRLAFLPQFPALSPGLLVRELVTLGRYPWHGPLGRIGPVDRAAVDAALDRTGMAPFADRALGTLSGGERQCAGIAMCVAQMEGAADGWLLLDEPVSALDLRHQQQVMTLVRTLNLTRGLGILVVLHDVNLAARCCDEVVALREGRVIAHGDPGRIMDPGVLHDIYGVRLGLLPDPAGGPPVAFLP